MAPGVPATRSYQYSSSNLLPHVPFPSCCKHCEFKQTIPLLKSFMVREHGMAKPLLFPQRTFPGVCTLWDGWIIISKQDCLKPPPGNAFDNNGWTELEWLGLSWKARRRSYQGAEEDTWPLLGRPKSCKLFVFNSSMHALCLGLLWE